MERLGLDYRSVVAVNPRVIYCSITGYGQHGPKRDVAAHDLNYIGDAGLLALSMGDPSRPIIPPALIADIAGGGYPAVINILLSLEERRRTGRGRHLDVAMTDNLFPLMSWAIGSGVADGSWPGNGTERVTGGSSRYGLYPTRDGKVVAAAPLEQKFWRRLCDIIALAPELRKDRKDPQATRARVAELIAGETAAVWRSRFSGGTVAARSSPRSRTRSRTRTSGRAACSTTSSPMPKGRSCRRSPGSAGSRFSQVRPERRSRRRRVGAHNGEYLRGPRCLRGAQWTQEAGGLQRMLDAGRRREIVEPIRLLSPHRRSSTNQQARRTAEEE